MSCGLAVAASNVGGVPDIITDGEDGFLVDGFDPNIWKEKVEKSLTLDSDKIRQKILDNFTVEKMAERYIEAYKAII
jgi:glycosyltransferase involved in cell wall biosynthesis